MEDGKVIVKKPSVTEAEDGRVIVKRPPVTEAEDGRVIVKRSSVAKAEESKVIVEELQTQHRQDAHNEDTQRVEMRMIVSAVLRKDGRSFARVSFLRDKDWAEGIVPDGVIEKSEGFTEEEIRGLQDYLVREKDMLVSQAKGVNPLRNMLGM